MKLISGNPIPIENIGTLYQPKIKDIDDMGFEQYNKLLIPFLIPINELIQEEFIDTVKYFDMFFIKLQDGTFFLKEGEMIYLDLLINSLKFYFKEEIKLDLLEPKILIGKNGFIDRNNFDELMDIIHKINLIKKQDVFKKRKKLSQRQQEIHDKLAKHRAKNAKLKEMQFEDIINIVMYGGDSFIPYSLIEDMTYYQLSNAYNIITAKNNYRDFLLYKTSEKYEIKEDVEHWIITIRK
jgi:hypothetical protein